MGIRHWIRKRLAEQQADGDDDSPPSGSIINSIFGREPPTLHALGEYDQKTYPGELQDLLRRREDVAEELREMDLTTRVARVDAIPRLQQMLRTYPHPLAYETLIHAYVDAGRWDEARGAAFAARERRTQVLRSPYSEIRAEVDRLKEWTPEEVDAVRREREGVVPPVQPTRPAEPARAAEPASSPQPAPVAVGAGAAAVQPVESVAAAAPDGDPGEPASAASADTEAASIASADAEPASVASDTEPASAASVETEPASVATAEPVAESTEAAVDTESAESAGVEATDEMGSEDDAESANAEEAGGGATASGGNGGGAARQGGKGPRSQRKGKRRR